MSETRSSLPRAEAVVQPCSEACVHYRRLDPERWFDCGLCENPRAPLRGYPVRPGRDCRHYGTGRGQPVQRDNLAA